MGVTRWIIVSHFHYGHHVVYVSTDRLINFYKVTHIVFRNSREEFVANVWQTQAFIGMQTLYFLNTTLTKISILFLLYRIFGRSKNFRLALGSAAIFVISIWIPCTILTFCGCTPFEKNWNKELPGRCIDQIEFFRLSGVCNLISDFLILLLPVPMVCGLDIRTRQKAEVLLMFAFGLLYVSHFFA